MAILVIETENDTDAVTLKHFLDKANYKNQIRFGIRRIDGVRFAGEELPADPARDKDAGDKKVSGS